MGAEHESTGILTTPGTRDQLYINNTRDKGPTLPLFGSRLGTLGVTMTSRYTQRVAGASGASVVSKNGAALAPSPVSSIFRLKKQPMLVPE